MRVPSENEKSRLATVFRRVPLIALVQRKVKTFNQSRRSERDRKQWRNRWTNPGSVVPQHRHPLKKYLVAWVLLLFAVGLFIAGFSLTDRSDMKAYLTDSLVQGSGVFAALTLAWFFFERHNQHEADRVFVGVRSRIVVIRNFACVSIMYLTSELFDVPPRKAEGYDPGYFSGHYGELRQTLGVGTGGSFNRLPEGFERNIQRFEWLFTQFIEVARRCERIKNSYVAALDRYPELLDAMDRLQDGVEGERRTWRAFIASRDERVKELHDWRRGDDRYRENFREPPEPDELPADAIANLLAIATASLSLVATITHVLRDWEDIPDPDDITMDYQIAYRGSVGGPNRWGDQRFNRYGRYFDE